MKSIISTLLALPMLACVATADVKPGHLAHQADYGMMYWLDGIRGTEWVLQTSRYALRYDHLKLGPVALASVEKPVPVSLVHTGPVPVIPPVECSFSVVTNGISHPATPASADPKSSAIIESGRFFQRRWQTAQVAEVPCDSDRTGLELSAWPDRLTLQFRFCPQSATPQASLETIIDFGDGWKSASVGNFLAISGPDGRGFVCQSLEADATIAFDPSSSRLRLRSGFSDWQARSHPTLGLVLHPVCSGALKLAQSFAETSGTPLSVSAEAVAPAVGALKVRHEPAQDWHRIAIPKGPQGDNDTLRAKLSLRNPSSQPRTARLMFDGAPFYIPGITAVLRDAQGFPTGIPVQLSKNWHGQPAPADHPAGFSGEWFHGISMISLPPSSQLELELIMVGENWGGIAAASHSQLCVVGYDGNQQWDQAALGNRGESLCYDLDHVLTDNTFTDCRPFGMVNSQGQRGWNINIGGGSVLRFADPDGKSIPNRRMRVIYPRYGPNLTEAVFSGTAADGALDFRNSASLFRADDCTRGLHRISIRVHRDTAFGRFVIYQQAGDTYHYNQGNTLSWGNAVTPQPIRTWQGSGTPGQVVGSPFPLTGPSPWVAITGGQAEQGYHPGNHGFIIRSWKAKLGGKVSDTPFVQERRTAANVSIMELVPPPGITKLRKGDFIELEIVRIYLPQLAEHYAGSNEPFRQALQSLPNDPRMVLREAAGNRLTVKPTLGRLLDTCPVVIQTDNNRAGFELQGGIGAVPVTFTGLTDYRNPVLEQLTPDGWKTIDQSTVGNDFWQCDFQSADRRWEITYTLKPDLSAQSIEKLIQSPQVQTYRFRAGIPMGEFR